MKCLISKMLSAKNSFYNLTSETKKFSDCFKMGNNFEEQSTKWKKTLDSFCHQAFKKVRLTPNKPQVTKISELMEERKSLKIRLKLCEDKQRQEELQQQVECLDSKIALECAEENLMKKVFP